jgi:hypothetical protein
MVMMYLYVALFTAQAIWKPGVEVE